MKYKKKREMESKKNKKRRREVDEPLLVARSRLLVISNHLPPSDSLSILTCLRNGVHGKLPCELNTLEDVCGGVFGLQVQQHALAAAATMSSFGAPVLIDMGAHKAEPTHGTQVNPSG